MMTPAVQNTYIALADQHGQKVGFAEKLYAHQACLLHFAFSLMVYRWLNGQLEVLLQQRAHTKYHCPGLWANTCCSHPQSLQDIPGSIVKRVHEELGLNLPKTSVQIIKPFIYKEKLQNTMFEYEYDFLAIAPMPEKAPTYLNPDEVAQIRWVSWNELSKEHRTNKELYAPWVYHVIEHLSPLLPSLKAANENK